MRRGESYEVILEIRFKSVKPLANRRVYLFSYKPRPRDNTVGVIRLDDVGDTHRDSM